MHPQVVVAVAVAVFCASLCSRWTGALGSGASPNILYNCSCLWRFGAGTGRDEGLAVIGGKRAPSDSIIGLHAGPRGEARLGTSIEDPHQVQDAVVDPIQDASNPGPGAAGQGPAAGARAAGAGGRAGTAWIVLRVRLLRVCRQAPIHRGVRTTSGPVAIWA